MIDWENPDKLVEKCLICGHPLSVHNMGPGVPCCPNIVLPVFLGDAELQTPIRERDEARALLRELRTVFQEYAKSHAGKATAKGIDIEERTARERKACINAAHAARIDTLLSNGGDDE